MNKMSRCVELANQLIKMKRVVGKHIEDHGLGIISIHITYNTDKGKWYADVFCEDTVLHADIGYHTIAISSFESCSTDTDAMQSSPEEALIKLEAKLIDTIKRYHLYHKKAFDQINELARSVLMVE